MPTGKSPWRSHSCPWSSGCGTGNQPTFLFFFFLSRNITQLGKIKLKVRKICIRLSEKVRSNEERKEWPCWWNKGDNHHPNTVILSCSLASSNWSKLLSSNWPKLHLPWQIRALHILRCLTPKAWALSGALISICRDIIPVFGDGEIRSFHHDWWKYARPCP